MSLMSLTAVELGKKIKAKEVTVEAAVREALDAVRAKEEQVHSFVTVDEEGALARAKEVQVQIDAGELTGPLAGVPVAIKDNMCTEGLLTTCSSKILYNFIPTYTAEAVKKLEEAGLILAVFDGSEPPSREDLALAQRCAGRPAIALVNKEDKPTRFDAELIAPYFAMVLPVCCREEESRKVIAAAVARLLGTGSIDPHAASLSGQRQLSAALRARDAVAGALDAAAGGLGLDAVSVCVDDALDALCDLTGENASEAVIEQVFERFCVGK